MKRAIPLLGLPRPAHQTTSPTTSIRRNLRRSPWRVASMTLVASSVTVPSITDISDVSASASAGGIPDHVGAGRKREHAASPFFVELGCIAARRPNREIRHSLDGLAKLVACRDSVAHRDTSIETGH